jgi:DNA transformation protein and related proteins
MNDLAKQPNLGKVVVEQLNLVEITTFEELKELGSEQAFIRIKTIDKDACINKLYALEGAIQGIRWHGLSKDRKAELLNFFRMLENSNND